jgi:hypothetical protein
MALTKVQTGSIQDSAVTEDKIDGTYTSSVKTNPEFQGTEAARMPVGSTAQRTGEKSGDIRFNTTTSLMEYYDGTQWKSIDSPPTVSSIDDTEVDSAGGGNQTIVITGSGFGSGATITYVGNAGTDFNASTVTVDSDTQITAVAPKASFLNAQEPYGVKVTNISGLSGTLASQINVDNSPNWSTSSGTLATIQDNATGTHATVSATDPDSDTIAYSVQSGSIPAGTSLNSSTGAISGDPTDVNSSTTSTFTVRATANSKTTDRSFNIIVNPSPVDVYYLLIAGGGSGGNGYGGGGGGAGGLLTNWGSTALGMYKGITYNVTVGDGGNTRPTGNNQGYDGENSTFGGSSGLTVISTLTAIGGGGGGSGGNISSSVGRDGGSGGGGGWTRTFRQGYGTYSGSSGGGIYDSSPRQGYDGSLASISNSSDVGGGGGGAGQAGYFTGGQDGSENVVTAPGFGGDGLQINIDGNNYYWAGGGGGGSDYNGNAGTTQGGDGGRGGGGYGLHTHRSNGSYGGSAINGSAGGNDAGNNTGGGGGAGATGAGGSGVGGSGIFILRYPNTFTATVGTLANNTITVGSDKVTYITGEGTGTISIA